MTIKTEMTTTELANSLWSGARDTLEDLTFSEFEQIVDMYEELYADMDDAVSLTEFNDFMWFERDMIAEWLGYSEYEELMKRDIN